MLYRFFFVLIIFIVAQTKTAIAEQRLSVSDEVNHYYTEIFKPKYKREECIVRLELEWFDRAEEIDFDLIHIYLKNFIILNEPFMSIVTISTPPSGDEIYLQFLDFCEKRFALADAIARDLTDKREIFKSVTVSRDRIKDSRSIGTDISEGLYLD